MSMYPREIVEAIKDRSDIVDLIGTYVSLKRGGSNYQLQRPMPLPQRENTLLYGVPR